MNEKRRNEISKLQQEIERIGIRLGDVKDEEQEYRDTLPENLQSGSKAEQSDDALAALENAVSHLDDAVTELANIPE